MKIYRGIALNEGEEIKQEIGRSWSLNEEIAAAQAWNHTKHAEKDGIVVLCADIAEDIIDTHNTELAADRRPREEEIVLLPYADITAEVYFSKIDGLEVGTEIVGTTGDKTFEDYL